ncbi:MAG: ABC transporter substrate-binding protein [Bacilli bacterium]
MRNSSWKKAVTYGLAPVTLLTVLSGCGTGVSSGPAPSTPTQKLVIGYEADATSLDPGQVTDINSMQVLVQMYDTLVKYSNSGKLEPDLATHWTVSPDGKTYTFTLRSGVKFSNGAPMTASDVVYSMERMLDKNNPGYQYGPYPFGEFFYGEITKVTAKSSHVVEFQLNSPDGAFLSTLYAPTAEIVSKKTALSEGKNFALKGCGTGPFMLRSWQRGQDLKLVDNPYYWGKKPKLTEVDFTPIIQQDERAQDLQSGSVQMVINPQPNSLSSLASAGYQVSMDAGPHIWWVGLNVSKPPFNNLLVRQAMNYAIDRPGMIKGILYGTGIPANQPLSPGQMGYNPNVNNYAYNPVKAKKLLAEAGYPKGFSVTFLVPTSGSGMQSPKEMGTVIQGYLAAVGIKVKIVELDWGTFLNRVNQGAQKGNMDMWELSWMDTAIDPSLVLGPLLTRSSWPPGFNSGYYDNPQVDKLIADAQASSDQAKRNQMYQEAEALINKDAPWIFVDHAKQIVAYSKQVKGFTLDKTFPYIIQLANVSIGQ